MRPRWWHALPVIAVAAVGVGLRLRDFGRYGFWTDEAWVALSTRAPDWSQFWLAIGPTPVGLALVLRPLALLGGPPEIVLRLVPLAFGLATLPLAYRIAVRATGAPLAGILALGAVALEPGSIEFAKMLKQYAGESFFTLLSVDAAITCLRSNRHLGRLAVIMAIGALFSTAQFVVTPAIIIALGIEFGRRRDTGRMRALGRVTLPTLGWLGVVYAVGLGARMSPQLLADYGDTYGAATSGTAFAFFARDWLWARARQALGTPGACMALVGLGPLVWRHRTGRVVVTVLGLVGLEILALAFMGRFPIATPRLTLFFTILGCVVAGAAVGGLADLQTGRVRGLLAVVLGLAFGASIVADRDRTIGQSLNPEDLGPLVQLVETERRPQDPVLVFERSSYVYAYYARATPRLLAFPQVAVGFITQPERPAMLVTAPQLETELTAALRTSDRVWILASRMTPADRRSIEQSIRRHGLLRREERARAMLLLVGGSPAHPPNHAP